jgi:hypothetical protein
MGEGASELHEFTLSWQQLDRVYKKSIGHMTGSDAYGEKMPCLMGVKRSIIKMTVTGRL